MGTTSGKFRRTRQGFTLVELLTVIVIIGILAGLITSAAVVARGMVKRKAVLSEIAQLDIALQKYKNEFGEYPPDFAWVTTSTVAQDRVVRHLRKRFPKYRPTGAATPWLSFCADVTSYYPTIDPTTFDAASALVFWLGGLPELAAADPWVPRGFHSDPSSPFKTGSPRSGSLYEFDPERLVIRDTADVTKQLRYVPRYIEGAPLVYFKAVKSAVNGQFEYGEVNAAGDLAMLSYTDTTHGICVPYLKEITTSGRNWEGAEKYQMICAGMDSEFGSTPVGVPATPGYRFTSTGIGFCSDDGDYDNLTSFSTSKLEDGIE